MNNKININANGLFSLEYQAGVSILDIAHDFKKVTKRCILGAKINNVIVDMSTTLFADTDINFFDYTDTDGNEMYQAGLKFILLIAFNKLFKKQVRFKYSLDKGLYASTDKRLTDQDIDALKEGMEGMLGMMKTMLVLIIGIAVLLGGIIIYNLGILSYTEKQYQFATLKVLGFTDKQIERIFIKQNNWIAIISIILGLPLGFYLTDFLFKTAIEEHYDFGASITIMTYVLSAVGTFLVSYLVSRFLARKIKKIDMVTSLKGNE